MRFDIQAVVGAQTFALGERVPVLMSLVNQGPDAAGAIDPRRGGEYLRFHVRVPGGEVRSFTMAEAQRKPGVPNVVTMIQCPPGFRWEFDWDLTMLTKVNQSGFWGVALEYQPVQGEIWRSAESQFYVLPPAGSHLEVVSSESSKQGQQTLMWVEREAAGGRALMLDFTRERLEVTLRGAVEIARLPMEAAPALSMSPAAAPFPDRWVAWISAAHLHFYFYARDPADRSEVIRFPGAYGVLIHPILAGAAPDEGRPSCLAGVLAQGGSGTQLLPFEISGKGEGWLQPAVAIPGSAVGAWALAPDSENRLFVIAAQVGSRVEVSAVNCPVGVTTQPPQTWFAEDGEYLAGDVVMSDDQQVIVGLLLKRGNEWNRIVFQAPRPGTVFERVVSRVDPGVGEATPVRARLDARGQLHCLFKREDYVHYVAPDSDKESWTSRRPAVFGAFTDLLLRTEPPGAAVVYYDHESGPSFLRI